MKKTETKIKSRLGLFETKLSCLLVYNITNNIPPNTFDYKQVQFPQNFQLNNLADQQFYKARQIDLLISVLQETVLGWLITGSVSINKFSNGFSCNFITEKSYNSLDVTLTKFWETEELPQEVILSPDS